MAHSVSRAERTARAAVRGDRGPARLGPWLPLTRMRLRRASTSSSSELSKPGFWDDQQHAASVSAEHARLTKRLERFNRLRREYEDARELLAMDGDMADEIEASLRPLQSELERLQEDALFTGEYDAGDARRHDPVGRRRHRLAGLGRDAAAHVPALGGAPRLPGRDARGEPGRGGRASSPRR